MKKLRPTKTIKKPNLGMSKQGSRTRDLNIKNNVNSKSNVWNISDKQLGQTN